MRTGILTTNGGPHSPDDWSLATAAALVAAFDVKPDSPNSSRIGVALERAKIKIFDIMIEHHTHAQEKERAALETYGLFRLESELSAIEHVEVEHAVADIRAALQPVLDVVATKDVVTVIDGVDAPEFEDHLMRIIRERVEMDIRTVMQIERDWHNDRKVA